MDEHRDLAVREDLHRLAAEDDRGHTVTTMRSHDDEIATFRVRGIDDRPVGMLMLDLDCLACDARCLRGVGDGAKGFLGLLLHACFVLSRRICVSVVNV